MITIAKSTELPTANSTDNVFPDFSMATDEQLTKTIKSGVAEIGLGLGLEYISSYVPQFSGQIHRTQANKESFGPKTVKGMGTVLLINGTKDLFFGTKEKYSRFWSTLSDFNKGFLDLTMASSIYGLTNYMPNIFYTPYLELGGQGAALILISYTSIRGLKYITVGTRDIFINTDLTQLCVNTKAKGDEIYTNFLSWWKKEKTA